MLYLLFFISIFCIAWNLDVAYFDKEAPTGYIASTLQDPSERMPNITECPYCTKYGSKINCSYWKYYDALYPTIEDTSMFITTYVKEWQEDYISNEWVPNNLTITQKFIPFIENYVILLQHAARTASFAINISENTQVSIIPELQYCDTLKKKKFKQRYYIIIQL